MRSILTHTTLEALVQDVAVVLAMTWRTARSSVDGHHFCGDILETLRCFTERAPLWHSKVVGHPNFHSINRFYVANA